MKREAAWGVAIEKLADDVIGTLTINIRAKAAKTALTLKEYVDTLRASGIADSVIRQNLDDDLTNGGRIFGEFFRGISMDVTGRIGELTRGSAAIRDGVQPDDNMTWVAVSMTEGDKACPDCTPRHGEVDTYQNWVLRGLPKTGWSVCRAHCKCILLRESDVNGEESLKEPVRITKEN
ncbi:MAG: hypothetical protein BWY42_00960 [Candidatus Omnitrophica bacterium ADurb.Bin277]|nr:MAG: hypothetical protein BWY42_00960 [Candidatus Omnitrophica bacterium ADurb.Bin277]